MSLLQHGGRMQREKLPGRRSPARLPQDGFPCQRAERTPHEGWLALKHSSSHRLLLFNPISSFEGFKTSFLPSNLLSQTASLTLEPKRFDA